MMKKSLMALMMVLAVGLNADAAAQKHRHTPTTAVSQVADTARQADDEVVAYSDTVATAGDVDSVTVVDRYDRLGADRWDELRDALDNEDMLGLTAIVMVVAIVFFVFVLAPVLILLIVFYFLNRRRKDRLRMAQMAMQNGQPIPDELLKETHKTADAAVSNDELWQRGLRQTFLGIGLMAFLGYTAGDVGFGIGMLVTCIGVGKLVIVKTSGTKHPSEGWPTHKD